MGARSVAEGRGKVKVHSFIGFIRFMRFK